MKATYQGPPITNWYGMNLYTGQDYEIDPSLVHKVKASPNWKVKTTRKKNANKSADPK